MSDIHFDIDPEHAVHFDRDEHEPIGHLLVFKLGTDVTLTPDLQVYEPKFQKAVMAVGLVSEVKWAGGPEDPMEISALISSTNRQQVMNLVHKAVSEISVKFSFTIYDYDDVKTKWYGALHTNDQEISGTVATKNEGNRVKLELSMATAPAKHFEQGNLSPQVWEMSAKIESGSTAQTIHFLTGALHKIVKDWGVEPE